MKNAIPTAYSELTRVLPWSLRALGYPFPVADRAANIISSAAAMAPDILDNISRASPRIKFESCINIGVGNEFSIDARGRSLLEIGPATIDFMGAQAPKTGFLCGTIEGTTDPEILSAVLLIGADYDLTCLAVFAGETGKLWVLQSGRKILQGADLPSLEAALLGATREFSDAVRQCFQVDTAAAKCVIFSTREALGLPADVPGINAIDANAMIAHANRWGIPVKPETLKAIYDLEKLTWAPTSERSRAQAGFQQSPGGAA